jgi:hypothetical protein
VRPLLKHHKLHGRSRRTERVAPSLLLPTC